LGFTVQESLILVDQTGHRTGVAGRDVCHQGEGIRHRAFVTFLIAKDGKYLVQKRTASKLGGDCWDVSATSHVWANETYGTAITRCLKHELGITVPVSPRYQLAYIYQQQLGHHAENEHCSLFLIDYDGPVQANADEMDEVRWLTFDDLSAWFVHDEKQFTQWFAEAFRRSSQ
jgi:isopentenyl-diphosphate Delta-isomerase